MENIKSSYNYNKFKISALTWSDKFQLPDGLYSVSNSQIILSIFLKSMERTSITHQ